MRIEPPEPPPAPVYAPLASSSPFAPFALIEAEGPTAEALSYTNLTRVFGTEVYVDTNSLTGKLLVVPLSGRAKARLDRDGPGPGSAA